eukprot:COSAG03_NODE_4372_length_1572_cov_1.537678_3_plen_86_part_00
MPTTGFDNRKESHAPLRSSLMVGFLQSGPHLNWSVEKERRVAMGELGTLFGMVPVRIRTRGGGGVTVWADSGRALDGRVPLLGWA